MTSTCYDLDSYTLLFLMLITSSKVSNRVIAHKLGIYLREAWHLCVYEHKEMTLAMWHLGLDTRILC